MFILKLIAAYAIAMVLIWAFFEGASRGKDDDDDDDHQPPGGVA